MDRVQADDAQPVEAIETGTGRLSRRAALRRAGQGGIGAAGLAALTLAVPATARAADEECTCEESGSGCACEPSEPVVPTATLETLPETAPEEIGRLRVLTDYDRGLWLDTGEQWVSLRGHLFDVRAFGATGDGETDDWPAFHAAIEAMLSALGEDSTTAEGSTLLVPPGTYRLAQSLVVNRAVRLTGVGAGGASAAAVLRFDAGLAGVVIEAAQPGLTGNPGRMGDGATVERLRIEAAGDRPGASEGGPAVPAYGVWLRTWAAVVACAVAGFGDDGIHVEGPESAGPEETAGWVVDGCDVSGCGGNGLGVSRASGGVCARLVATGNAGWGIADESGLGNSYLQCRAVDNRGGAFTSTGDTNRSLFLGCVSASGQPASRFAQDTIVVGGDHRAGFWGGNAWTATGARMFLLAQTPATGEGAPPTAPTLHLRGAQRQTQPHLLVDAAGERLAELDVAGRLFLGPEGTAAVTVGEGAAASGPQLLNLIGAASGGAGIRWEVAGEEGGLVAQVRAFREAALPDAPGGTAGAWLLFETATPSGQTIETMTLRDGHVGIGTATPLPAAILDLTSTTRGFLPPRMTEEQRDAIGGPPEGSTIYNLSSHRLNIFDGAEWREVPFTEPESEETGG